MAPFDAAQFLEALTAGRFEGVRFPDLLWALSRTGRTGVLRVEGHPFRTWLYVDRGRVIYAATDDPDQRIGSRLLRTGAIGLDELRQALERQRPGRRLGLLLVEAGSLGEAELLAALRQQFRSIVLNLFECDRGAYRFFEGALPSSEPITLAESTQDLIHAGIRRVRSFALLRRAVGGPATMLGLADGWQEVLEGLSLREGESEIVERLAGGVQNVESLCREVTLANFEILQALWSLLVLGVVREVAPGQEDADDELFVRPEPGEGFAEFLLGRCRNGESGVIYASRRGVERTFHLDGGRCTFATSTDSDDGLVAWLLRRGVISLRDREQVASRRLTNKRVGTILLELGIIDDPDLRDAVRRHLIEIVWGTLGWEDGDFAFVGGPLPSAEEITLELNVESLMAEGLRRVSAWSLVRRGCGGLDSTLRLDPCYLAVLDAMGAGVEEWDVAAALKEPATALEVCRALPLGDFRVCQILWCLRVLGAVKIDREVEDRDDAPLPLRRLEPRPVEIPVERQDEEVEVLVTRIPDPMPLASDEPADALAGHADEPSDDELADVPVEASTHMTWAERDAEGVESHSEAAASMDVDAPAAAPEDVAPEPSREANHEAHTGEPPAASPHIEWEDRAVECDEQAEAFDAPAFAVPVMDCDEGVEEQAPVPADDPAEKQADGYAEERASMTAEQPGEELADLPVDSEVSIFELERATRTVRISAEEAERALRSAEASGDDASHGEMDGPVEAVEPADAWNPPGDLDDAIARFNSAQRIVYRTVRVAIGAGAANLVRACCGGEGADDVVGSAALHNDGSFSVEDLRDRVVELRIEDPWNAYSRLIERELAVLRDHLGAAQADALMSRIEQADPGAVLPALAGRRGQAPE